MSAPLPLVHGRRADDVPLRHQVSTILCWKKIKRRNFQNPRRTHVNTLTFPIGSSRLMLMCFFLFFLGVIFGIITAAVQPEGLCALPKWRGLAFYHPCPRGEPIACDGKAQYETYLAERVWPRCMGKPLDKRRRFRLGMGQRQRISSAAANSLGTGSMARFT